MPRPRNPELDDGLERKEMKIGGRRYWVTMTPVRLIAKEVTPSGVEYTFHRADTKDEWTICLDVRVQMCYVRGMTIAAVRVGQIIQIKDTERMWHKPLGLTLPNSQ